MVQIGNFHVGRYDTAEKSTLSSGEAFALWDNLVSRYDWIDTLSVLGNYAHDSELHEVIGKKKELLEKQAAIIEQQLEMYSVPLPPRPRKSIKFEANSGAVRDEFIFRRIVSGAQDFLSICSVAMRCCIVNDTLRDIFHEMLLEKIEEFDKLCIIAKKKGWMQVPPLMKIH